MGQSVAQIRGTIASLLPGGRSYRWPLLNTRHTKLPLDFGLLANVTGDED
jgi:hypothetical protein